MNKDYIDDDVREIIANEILKDYTNGMFTLQVDDNEWVDVSWELKYTIDCDD